MSDPTGSETTEEQDVQKAMDIIDGYETISNDIKSMKEIIKKFEIQTNDSTQGEQPPPDPQTPPPSTETDPPPPQTPPTTSPEVDESLKLFKEESQKGISELTEQITKLQQQVTSMTTGRSKTFKFKGLDKNEDDK